MDCLFCGRPAAHLCDYLFGMDEEEWLRVASERKSLMWIPVNTPAMVTRIICDPAVAEVKAHRCDAPMCSECRTVTGFYCSGKDGCDTVDLCPHHRDERGSDGARRYCTPETAERVRQAIRHVWSVGLQQGVKDEA